jgi:hypothetical protein
MTNPMTSPYSIDKSLDPDDFPGITDDHWFNAPFNDKQVGGTHYKDLPIQPWEVMEAWFPESFPDYLLMNAIKYIARNKGNKKEDIAKAHHYLEKWLELNK